MSVSSTMEGSFQSATRQLHSLGPMGYAVVLHLRGLTARFTERTYPTEWIDFYDRQGFAVRDPVLGWCVEHTGALRWSEPGLVDPYNVMAEASRHGLKYGMSVSTGPRDCRSIINVARSDRELSGAEREQLLDLGSRLPELLPPEVTLSAKQIEALKCVAGGYRRKQAVEILGISDTAYRLRIEAARKRLHARTTAEAIQRAKDYRLI